MSPPCGTMVYLHILHTYAPVPFFLLVISCCHSLLAQLQCHCLFCYVLPWQHITRILPPCPTHTHTHKLQFCPYSAIHTEIVPHMLFVALVAVVQWLGLKWTLLMSRYQISAKTLVSTMYYVESVCLFK